MKAALLRLVHVTCSAHLTDTNNPAKHTWRESRLKIGTIFYGTIIFALFAWALDAPAGEIVNPRPVTANNNLLRHNHAGVRVRVATLLANDTNASHDTTLTLNSVSPKSAAGGTVVKRGKWIFYKPPVGFTNADSFSYVITGIGGLQTTGSVTITIHTDLAPSQNVAANEHLANNASHVRFAGIPGRVYTIQYAENLETPGWQTLGTRTADATGRFEFTDTPATGSPARFYRSTYP